MQANGSPSLRADDNLDVPAGGAGELSRKTSAGRHERARHAYLAVDTVNKNRPYQGTRKTNTDLRGRRRKAPATQDRRPAPLSLYYTQGGQRA